MAAAKTPEAAESADTVARRAFLDESIAPHRFYTMSAAVINADDETWIGKTIRDAGLDRFHAGHTNENHRRAMENLLSDARIRTIVTVAAPMTGSPEHARQDCLSTLATVVRSTYHVTDLVMDSRDDLRIAPGKRQSRPNDIDRATIAKLNDGRPDPIELTFADDQRRPALTLADAAAWRTRHALANDSLAAGVDEFARLAPITQLLDAASTNVTTIFQQHLNAFRATSLERTAGQHLSPDQKEAFHRKWDTDRAKLSRRVQDGAPDLPFYVNRPDQRRSPAPHTASVWDTFADSDTTVSKEPAPEHTEPQRQAPPGRTPRGPTDLQPRSADPHRRQRPQE